MSTMLVLRSVATIVLATALLATVVSSVPLDACGPGYTNGACTCSSAAKSIDCTSKGLTEAPNIPMDVYYLCVFKRDVGCLAFRWSSHASRAWVVFCCPFRSLAINSGITSLPLGYFAGRTSLGAV